MSKEKLRLIRYEEGEMPRVTERQYQEYVKKYRELLQTGASAEVIDDLRVDVSLEDGGITLERIDAELANSGLLKGFNSKRKQGIHHTLDMVVA